MNNIKFRAVISVLLIFIAGVVAGAVLTFLLFDHGDMHSKQRFIKSKHPPEQNFFEYLSKELELTAEQKKEVKAILRENSRKFKEIEKEMHVKYEEVRKDNRKKIMNLLNEEQKINFNDFIKKVKQRILKSRK
jgi:hypothetical protein